MQDKIFRYTKKEKLLGIIWLIAFLFFSILGISIPFIVKRHTSSDIYAMVAWFIICFIGIIYSVNLWLRRQNFSIKIDKDSLIISKLGKSQRIYWKDIKSYKYQFGHPYWFISLYLVNNKHINLHGELDNFDTLIKIIKENVKNIPNEFQYTIRRRINILSFWFLLSLNISIAMILLIYVFNKRMPLSDTLGIVALILVPSCMIIFGEFRFSQTKFYANNEGLVIKQCMRKRIFISWSAIRNESQIDLANTRPTLAARLWELTIKSGDKFIVIFEDLDNVDELVDIIKTKTGLSLGM